MEEIKAVRLQKYMAEAGVASRRKCEELIIAGRVSVNGQTATLGMSVDPQSAVVELDGKRLERETARFVIALNKPRGVMCTVSDPEGRETVMDCFKGFEHRLYNAGRLDYDSEGLLIMTNDGDFAYKITHPKFVMDKTYHAIVDGELTQAQRSTLERGVALDDGFTTSPARINNTHKLKNGNSSFDITIHEGHNRQVRRMLSAVGRETLLLRRVKIGPIELGDLQSGKWRYLTPVELAAFERELGGDK